MIGNGIVLGVAEPAYWVVYPWYVCLSVPQMPDSAILTKTAPGSGSGNGYSRIS